MGPYPSRIENGLEQIISGPEWHTDCPVCHGLHYSLSCLVNSLLHASSAQKQECELCKGTDSGLFCTLTSP